MQKHIPASVWLATAALGVVAAMQAALTLLLVRGGQVGFGHFAFAGVLGVALLVGLLRGARLAWLWARYLALFLAVLVASRAAVAVVRNESQAWVTALVVGGVAVPLVIAAFALLRPSAFAFFRLICPACGATTRRSADLLFRHARCSACGNLW
jgi:hypothetical protein